MLKQTHGKALEGIQSAIRTLNLNQLDSDSVPRSAQSSKKLEDSIVFNLQIVIKTIRGSAEVLGDNKVGSGDLGGSPKVLHTGRQEVLQGLGSEERVYLNELRYHTLDVLDGLYTALASIPLSSPFHGLKNSPDIQKKWIKVR